MKIQTALVSAFLAISLVIGIISISGIASIHNTIMDISKHEIPRMQNIMHMKTFLKDASKNIADYVKSDDLQERNEFYANTGAFNTLLNIYSDMNGTSREVELLNKLELEFPIFQQSGNELILIQDSQREQVVQLNLVNDNIVSTIGSLQKNLEPSAQNFTQKLTALIRMENSIREVVSSSQSYLIQQDTVLKERVKKGIDNFERSQKEFLANSLTREENVNTTLIKKYFDTIQSASSDLITLEDKKQAMLERFELSERSIGNIFDELELVINDRINQEQKTAIDTA
ncbi:MAG: MCP four helix bundle domain-containing protein, partial [Nitrososphaerales archaeon]